MKKLRVLALVLAGCMPTQPSSPRVVPADDGKPGCGARWYGVDHNPGDSDEVIARRMAGTVACASPCDPRPAFASGPLGRNEHGGYSFLEVAPAACQLPGMDLAITDCHATCEGQDRLGRLEVATQPASDTARATLCRDFEVLRGPPDVGSCACLDHDVVWRPNATLAGVVLRRQGTFSLECGFPEARYASTRPPG